jgi:hypothetical protein
MGPCFKNCLPAHINKIEAFESFKYGLTSLLLQIPEKPPVKGCSFPNSQIELNPELMTMGRKPVSVEHFVPVLPVLLYRSEV